LGGNIRTVRKNTEAVIITSKEIGLEVNAEIIKYMVMSRDQNAGQNNKYRWVINPLKLWKSLNIWKQT
jgi:hypothetical protein